MHYDPFVTRLVQEGKGDLLFDLTTQKDTLWLDGSEYPYLGLVTRRDVLRLRPQEVQAVVNSLVAAQRFLQQRNPEEVARALPSDFGTAGPRCPVEGFAWRRSRAWPRGLARRGAEGSAG